MFQQISAFYLLSHFSGETYENAALHPETESELRGCSTGDGEVANKQATRMEVPPTLLREEEVR